MLGVSNETAWVRYTVLFTETAQGIHRQKSYNVDTKATAAARREIVALCKMCAKAIQHRAFPGDHSAQY